MAHVDLYQAGSWYELIEQQERWLDNDSCIMIIPEDETPDSIATLFPTLEPSSIFTIPQLIERYVVRSLGRKGLISQHSMESIMGSIINEGIVPYFKIEQYRQGYVKALTAFIHKFRKTSKLDLQAALKNFKTEQLSFKEEDLLKIYTAYGEKLLAYGFDFRSGLEHLLHPDPAPGAPLTLQRRLALPEQSSLVFFGFTYITPLEEEFIEHVFNNGERTVFLTLKDGSAAAQAVRVQKSIDAFLESCRDGCQDLKITETVLMPRQALPLAHFARILFQDSPPGGAAPCSTATPAPMISVGRENNRFSEVVCMARRIRTLAAAGVPFDSMRIVAPQYDLYKTLMDEVFPDYGIPCYPEEGIALLKYPLAAVIYSLVSQATSPNPFGQREMIFSSPYISFEAPVTSDVLLNYQAGAGVECMAPDKLRQQLSSQLPAPAPCRLDFTYIKNLRKKAYRAINPPTGTHILTVAQKYLNQKYSFPIGSDARADAGARDKEMLRCLTQFYLLAQAEKGLNAWHSRMSCAAFKEGVFTLIRRFQVGHNVELLETDDVPLSPAEAIRTRDRIILEQLAQILDKLTASLEPMGEAGGEKFPLPELVRTFCRIMDEARLDAPPSGGVVLQSVHRGQYKLWDYTFICGMVDGEFPVSETYNFLQPKKEGLSLGATYTSVDHGRNHFHHLVATTAKALYLSLPVSHSGKRLPISPFVAEVEKIMAACAPPAGTAPQEEAQILVEYKAETDGETLAEQGPANLFSIREKLLCIGKNADHDYEVAQPLLQEIHNKDASYFERLIAMLHYDGLTLDSTALSQYDGIFSGEAPTLEQLAQQIRPLTFTPAVLERYAACPLRFFLDDLLGLRQDGDYHPDSTEKGVLIRSVLQEYTRQARANGEHAPDVAPLILEMLTQHFEVQEADGTADAFTKRLQKQLAAGLAANEGGRPGLFANFLNYENRGPDRLQLHMGPLTGTLHLHDQLVIPLEIDRVDITTDGTSLCLYLYSTAGTGDPLKISQGLRFDLPLAILLLQQLKLEQGLPQEVVGGGTYMVKSPREIKRGGYFALKKVQAPRQSSVSDEKPIFSGQRHGFFSEDEFTATLEATKERVLRIHHMIRRGVFHLPLCDISDQSCANCSFGRICRKEQLRLDRLLRNLQHREDLNIIRASSSY